MDGDSNDSLRKQHHERTDLCTTRPKYREGRMLKAVKAYTVSDESQYLLIRGLSVVQGAFEGLVLRLKEFGDTEEEKVLKDYPLLDSEKFTQVVLVKFCRIQSARIAKRKIDDLNYLGEVLHACYAPEFESIEETRTKLEDRRKAVTKRLAQLNQATPRSCNDVNHKIVRPNSSIPSNQSISNAPVRTLDCNSHANGNQRRTPSKLMPRQIHKTIRQLDVNAMLRRNALILRDESQGPQLPEHLERKRKTFHRSEMGDESLDQVQEVIRKKMGTNGR